MTVFQKELEEICFKKFEPDSKIGIFASVAPDGYPHLALISSILAKDKQNLMWGQFSRGLSKTYLKDNPKNGFLVVSADQYWWTGKALHTGETAKGEDFEHFNDKPMFRYNSYFGIGAVHYEKIIDVSAGQKLPIPQIAVGALKAKYAAAFSSKNPSDNKLPSFGKKLAARLTCLKFISYIDKDGYPRILPALQCAPVDGGKLVFSLSAYPELINDIPKGAKTAVFLASLDLTNLLLQGIWEGVSTVGGVKVGVFTVDKVYNSMIPIGRYIYPETKLKGVFTAEN
ncbi:MAG: hypothetical protein LBT20_07885 [Clostridiales bacterium]|jgi:hypothetical protein|nr:hypothetical protein [Clostridiales bacterium]